MHLFFSPTARLAAVLLASALLLLPGDAVAPDATAIEGGNT